ncbi:MAG: TonB-dependent receptor [Pseudomonadota bacterium]|nr:TonB-dependent receptor [Pseudomonadota bacterium]
MPNEHLSRHAKRCLAAGPAIFGALAAHAAGQLPPADPAPLQQIEIKGAYDARRDDTATRIVITQEEIGRYGDATIGELLKRVPGVTISGVPGHGGEIRMRGLGNGYTQILLDGQPVPPGFSLDSLAPATIARIEVMRAASAETSAQAIAGTINIVLKKVSATAKREIKAGLQQENDAPGANADFQLSDRAGALAWSLAGATAYNRNAWPFDFITEGSDPAGAATLLRRTEVRSTGRFESANLAPRVSWTAGPDDVIALQGFLNVNRLRGDDLVRIATLLGEAPRYSGAAIRIESDFQLARGTLSWTRTLQQGASLDTKAGVSAADRDSRTTSSEYDAASRLSLTRAIATGAADKGVTLNGTYAAPVAEAHALKAGWDGEYRRRAESRSQRERAVLPGVARDLDESFDADVARLALFAQDDWTIGPRWSLYAGLRWEALRTRSSAAAYAAHSRSSVWSPSLQSLWKVPGSQADQLRLALARTYKAPETGRLVASRVVAENNSATTPDFSGNPALRPELAWGLDLAYEHNLAGGGLLSASVNLRRIDDVIVQRVGLVDGAWLSTPVNAGVATTRGVELEAKLPLRSIDKSAPDLELRANLARNWSSLSSVPGPDNRLDQQTAFSGTVGADYKFDKLPMTVGGSYSFQNGGPVRISVNQYAYSVPKRSLDLYGLWKFNPKNQLRISLANALHQDNLAQSSYVDATGRLSDTTITPTAVAVRALMEMKF